MDALNFIQRLANVLFYLLFLAATVYTVVGPAPNDILVMKGQTYITPANWINFVWLVVHALLGGFVIYQWFDSAKEVAVNGIGWYFMVSATFSIAWLVSLKTGYYFLAFLFVLVTSFSVSYLYYKLNRDYPAANWCDKLFMLGPFSLWHGWIVYFAVINLFQAFMGLHKNGPTVLERILVIIGLAFLTFTAISYVEYKKYRGDITGAAVIGIGLLAIFSNQHDPWIHWIALICGITTLLYATRPYLFGLVSPEENVPLIP